MMNIKRTAEDAAAGENPDELYLAENVFWVPKEARRAHLQANAKQPRIRKMVADAMAGVRHLDRGHRLVHQLADAMPVCPGPQARPRGPLLAPGPRLCPA